MSTYNRRWSDQVATDELGAEAATTPNQTFASGYYLGCKQSQSKLYAYLAVGFVAGCLTGSVIMWGIL